jgi:hypothetical protein
VQTSLLPLMQHALLKFLSRVRDTISVTSNTDEARAITYLLTGVVRTRKRGRRRQSMKMSLERVVVTLLQLTNPNRGSRDLFVSADC